MKIRCGYKIAYDVRQPCVMILVLNVAPDREADLITPDLVTFDRPVEMTEYRDLFGNRCLRIKAEPGPLAITNDFLIEDSGLEDEVAPDAEQQLVEHLPPETLVYLLGSRYCDTQHLASTAWATFGHLRGWPLVQAIVDYAHERITFGYGFARATKTAAEAHEERQGVCRDFAHLAVTLCRCLNVPARYTTGYLGDIGVPPVKDPMDFSAWFEVYLGGRWYTFDARHNRPRIGRIVMARGRDAADVAIVTSFGNCWMTGFEVITEEVA